MGAHCSAHGVEVLSASAARNGAGVTACLRRGRSGSGQAKIAAYRGRWVAVEACPSAAVPGQALADQPRGRPRSITTVTSARGWGSPAAGPLSRGVGRRQTGRLGRVVTVQPGPWILFRPCSAGTQKTPETTDNCRKVIPQLRAGVEEKAKVNKGSRTEPGLQAGSSLYFSLTREERGLALGQGTSSDERDALSSACLARAEASGTTALEHLDRTVSTSGRRPRAASTSRMVAPDEPVVSRS